MDPLEGNPRAGQENLIFRSGLMGLAGIREPGWRCREISGIAIRYFPDCNRGQDLREMRDVYE